MRLELSQSGTLAHMPEEDLPRGYAGFHSLAGVLDVGAGDARWVTPDTPLLDALSMLLDGGVDGLPVRNEDGSYTLGYFSFKTAVEYIAELQPGQIGNSLQSGTVGRCHIDASELFEAPSREVHDVISKLNDFGAVLVGDEDRLSGVLRQSDVVSFLADVAQPFLLLSEIETALRDLISSDAPVTWFADAAERCLSQRASSGGQPPPTSVDKATLGDLVATILNGENFAELAARGAVFGVDRDAAKKHLERLPAIRNEVFHFRGPLNPSDLAYLRSARRWLRRRARLSGRV